MSPSCFVDRFLTANKRMLCNELLRLLVPRLNESIQFGLLDSPLAPATNFYGAHVAVSDQRVGLRRRDVQNLRQVRQGQESTSHPGSVPPTLRL